MGGAGTACPPLKTKGRIVPTPKKPAHMAPVVGEESQLAFQHCSVESIPIVEVVQIHRVAERAIVVSETAGAKNPFSGIVIMIVTSDGGVQFLDIPFVQFNSGLFFNPGFKLSVVGLIVFDVIECFLAIQTQPVQDHLVVTLPGARITAGQFAARFEGNF